MSGPESLDSCPGDDCCHPAQGRWDVKGCCYRSWLWAVSQHIHGRMNGKCGRKDNINLEGIVTQGPLKNMEEIHTGCSFSRSVLEPPHISTTAKSAKTWSKNRGVSVLVGQQTATRWGWVVLTGSRCLLGIKTDALLIFSTLSCRLCRGPVPTVPEAHQTDQTRPGKLREAERRMVRGMNPTWLVCDCWVMMENSTNHLWLQRGAGSGFPVPFQVQYKCLLSLSICLPKPWWLGVVFPLPLSRDEAIMTRTWSKFPPGWFAPIFT